MKNAGLTIKVKHLFKLYMFLSREEQFMNYLLKAGSKGKLTDGSQSYQDSSILLLVNW